MAGEKGKNSNKWPFLIHCLYHLEVLYKTIVQGRMGISEMSLLVTHLKNL